MSAWLRLLLVAGLGACSVAPPGFTPSLEDDGFDFPDARPIDARPPDAPNDGSSLFQRKAVQSAPNCSNS